MGIPERRRALRVRIAGCAALALLGIAWGWRMIRMPGESYSGPLPPLGEAESALAAALRRDVLELAVEIGERNIFVPDALARAADFLETRLAETGRTVQRQQFEVDRQPCCNLDLEIAGTDRAREIVVVGAHYDSVAGSPGANDNGTGVAALLALAEILGRQPHRRTLRFVAFVNEEPPFFQSDSMGSRVCARACRERGDHIVAMLSLETMGYYSDRAGSQQYPFPMGLFYPRRGDFIGFVGCSSQSAYVRRVVGTFRRVATFPSQGAALPGWIPGVGWSDHWAFWQEGYPALMVTDTAPFRYPHYHTAQDTPDKIDYERLARVVTGLTATARLLAGG